MIWFFNCVIESLKRSSICNFTFFSAFICSFNNFSASSFSIFNNRKEYSLRFILLCRSAAVSFIFLVCFDISCCVYFCQVLLNFEHFENISSFLMFYLIFK
jgi:hypothetical protein